jgi:hypothetical protein
MTSKRTTEPALSPSMSTLARCPEHRSTPLTRDGECPTCDRVAFMAQARETEHAKEAAKLQALTRVTQGKPRADYSHKGAW